jgi:hypothetical protein
MGDDPEFAAGEILEKPEAGTHLTKEAVWLADVAVSAAYDPRAAGPHFADRPAGRVQAGEGFFRAGVGGHGQSFATQEATPSASSAPNPAKSRSFPSKGAGL